MHSPVCPAHTLFIVYTTQATNSHSAHKTWESLGEIAELIQPTATNRDEFLQECRDGKLDGVVAAYRTFDSVSITGLVDEEIVNALPSSLKYLAHCGMFIPPVRGEGSTI